MSTASCIAAGLPYENTASIAALAVLPVYMTSSTSTTVFPRMSNGRLLSEACGSSFVSLRASRYYVIKRYPTSFDSHKTQVFGTFVFFDNFVSHSGKGSSYRRLVHKLGFYD